MDTTQPVPEVGFKSFAFVELFGHGRIAGFVTEEKIAGASFLRVEVPATSRQEAFVRSYGPSAIFAITPLPDEAECQQVAEKLNAPRLPSHLLCEDRPGPAWPLGVGEDDDDSPSDEVEPEDAEDADDDFWPDEPEQDGDGREWVDEPPTG